MLADVCSVTRGASPDLVATSTLDTPVRHSGYLAKSLTTS